MAPWPTTLMTSSVALIFFLKPLLRFSLRKQPVRAVTDDGTDRVPYKVPRQ